MVGPPGPVCLILVGARRGETDWAGMPAPTRMLGAGGLARPLKSVLKLVHTSARKSLSVAGPVLRTEARAQPPVIRQGRADEAAERPTKKNPLAAPKCNRFPHIPCRGGPLAG